MVSESEKPSLYEILAVWIRTWEDLLKEPRNLLLDRSFVNIIHPALIEIHRFSEKRKSIERSFPGWPRVLLELLQEEFRAENHEVQFFKLEFAREMQALNDLLKEGKFNSTEIYRLLKTIRKAPSVKTVFAGLAKEYSDTNDVDFDRLVAATRLILRGLLTKHSISTLKETLQVSLSRHGIYLAVEELLPRITDNTDLLSRISISWKLFLDECLAFDRASVKSDPAKGLTELFGLYSWHSKTRKILDLSADAVAQLLINHKPTFAAELVRARSLITEEFSAILWREYSTAYFCQLLEMPMGGVRRENEHLDRIGTELATILLETSFDDKQFSHSEPYRPNPVDACCHDAFKWTVQKHAQRAFASEVERDSMPPDLARDLLESLWNDESFSSIDWTNVDNAEIEHLCIDWASDLEVQKKFMETLLPFNADLDRRFRKLISEPQFVSFQSWVEKTGFWSDWQQHLCRMASWNRGVFHYIPFESFDGAAVKELFDRAARDFVCAEDEWWVMLLIDRLKPPPKPKRIAGITFYDPRRWDYREKIAYSGEPTDRQTAAKVKVRASSSQEAKRIGAAQLGDILNCMALYLSADRNWGGYEPIVDPEVFAYQQTSGNWSLNQPLIRSDRAIIQGFEKFEHAGSMFDSLINASRSAGATMLQEKLLKALNWYSKARWEQDPAESLLFYWIALEHLFDEGNDERLLNLIASLHINWRTVLSYSWYFLSRHEDEIMSKLAADLEISTLLSEEQSLRDWNQDRRVLLKYRNVQSVLNLIPTHKQPMKDSVARYAEYLQSFSSARDSILRETEALREHFRFRLLILKHVRNDIVHRASFYDDHIVFYAEELEDIFESAIVKLTNDAIQKVPRCASIRDLITQYEELWIS